MVFADVSGFTRLSERLARRGNEGGEQLVDLINACFTALLAEAYGRGGSLVKFGGDAMVLLFYDQERNQEHALRACAPPRRCGAGSARSALATRTTQICIHQSRTRGESRRPQASRSGMRTRAVGSRRGGSAGDPSAPRAAAATMLFARKRPNYHQATAHKHVGDAYVQLVDRGAGVSGEIHGDAPARAAAGGWVAGAVGEVWRGKGNPTGADSRGLAARGKAAGPGQGLGRGKVPRAKSRRAEGKVTGAPVRTKFWRAKTQVAGPRARSPGQGEVTGADGEVWGAG